MTNSGASHEIRLMALELVVADMLATIHRTMADPIQSLEIKRSKFRWLTEDNKAEIADSTLGRFYPEELQVAVDQL